jgi:oxygen-dependent protoporphyrinogen oxidase
MKKVVIIGAGFSGMSLAFYLRKAGIEVEIYDIKKRVGGLLGTQNTSHGLAETAANGILFTPRLGELCNELGLEVLAPLLESKKRYIFRLKPSRWPLTLLESIRFIFPLAAKFIFFRKKLIPKTGESIQEWGVRNLGKTATHFLLESALKGIYAGDISKMSSQLILGRFFKKKNSNKNKIKGTISFNGGMQELVDKLESQLKAWGVGFYFGQSRKPSSDVLTVVATSAWDASEYLKDCEMPMKTQKLLSEIEPISILTGTYFFESSQINYPGFGCLFPSLSPTRALGVLMNSYIFKGRNKYYNETWIMGGSQDQSILNLSDEEICNHISESRNLIFEDNKKIINFKITRWAKALPHYTLKHEAILESLDNSTSALLSKGVLLHGNYLGGIGLSQILDRSFELSQKIRSMIN